MNTTVRLKIKKEVDTPTARKILKLKGGLIANSFTDIIHFDDDGDEFYIHYFAVHALKKTETINYTGLFIAEHDLSETVIIL